MLNRDTINALESCEVFEYDNAIKVLDSKENSLEADDFDFIHVKNKERVLWKGDQTLLSWPNTNDSFNWAPIELQIFYWNVNFDWSFVDCRSLFN